MCPIPESGATELPPSNPFLDDIFVDSPSEISVVESIHTEIVRLVTGSLNSLGEASACRGAGAGRAILLMSPRAGYGKSHLLASLRISVGARATSFFLPFDPARPISWPVLLASLLRQGGHGKGPRSAWNSQLDEIGQALLAEVVIHHRNAGLLHGADCPAGLADLDQSYSELLSRHSSSDWLDWVDQRAAELSRESSVDFLRCLGLSPAELSFWVRLFVDLNLRDESSLESLRGLSQGEARERCLQLLRISSLKRPVLLVADGLDGFYASETAGLEVATLLSAIREEVPRSLSLLCLNEDVWEAVFAHSLPSAWLDRIAGEQVRLAGIDGSAAGAIVRGRLRGRGLPEGEIEDFVRRLEQAHLWEKDKKTLYPRQVLRQARQMWAGQAYSAGLLTEVAEVFSEPVSEAAVILDDGLERSVYVGVAGDAPEMVKSADEASEGTCAPTEGNDAVSFAWIPAPMAEVTRPLEEFVWQPAEAIPAEAAQQPVGDEARANEIIADEAKADEAKEDEITQGESAMSPREDTLLGIESIIRDIRQSGWSVSSKSGSPALLPPIAVETRVPAHRLSEQSEETPAPSITPTVPSAAPEEGTGPELGFFAGMETRHSRPSFVWDEVISPAAPSITLENLTETLHKQEQTIKQQVPIILDLARIEAFLKELGRFHVGLHQQEDHFPGGRTASLRWQVRGLSVLVGFEPPQNIYFWNNLLQQSLANPRPEKIVAFSHSSLPFGPSLFAHFGFSPAVVEGRVDIVEMGDEEWAMLCAAEAVWHQLGGNPQEASLRQRIVLFLDPLWRRISHPL